MNRQTLQDIFRQPFNEQSWKELLINLFGTKEIRSTPAEIESDTNKQIKGYLFGELRSSDRYSIGLFAFEVGGHTNIELNRVGLRSLVKSYTRYEYDAALTVYYNDDQWRLSFICDLRGENTAPKRYTYVFGNEAESYRTAADRLIKLYDTNPTFEAIKDAFSVEQLSKDFFKEYKQQYSKFIAYIGDTKPNRDYVKKMLGRLVFLQFLQKKGWMGVPTTGYGWCGGDLQYLQNLVRKYEGNDRLLSDVLEVLFFDTLNTKRDDDIAPAVLGDSIKIPYLNGGLFDRDTIDNKDIDFPYAYFADLMEFFSHYNFTIDENDPYDAEVGIDPEMLGHIFENLLEDNKDKGAFYTPKEIVQYMCRQSLVEYLQSKLGKDSALESFVNQHDVSDKFIIENATEIEDLLDNIKICDPAIGSGAFPMGILNEVFHCKMALDLTLNRAEVKKNIIQNSIYGVDIEQGAVDIARLRFWLSLVVEENEPQPLPNLDYKIMCGNSLLSRYALDTPISEVFAEYNKENKTDFSLEDYKALVADYTNTSSKSQKADFRTKIEEIKRAFKTTLDTKQITKRIKLQSKINSLRSDNLFGSATKAELKEAKELEKKLKVMLQNESDIQNNRLYENAFEWRFEFPALLSDDGSFLGFDIVIGNPPYISAKNIDKTILKEYQSKFISAKGQTDIYAIFIERAINVSNHTGIISYIVPDSLNDRSNFTDIRRLMLEQTNIKSVLTINDVFESATVGSTIFIVDRCMSKSVTNLYRTKNLTTFKSNNIEHISISQNSIYKNDNNSFLFIGSNISDLLYKIYDHSTTIADYCNLGRGEEIGRKSEAILPRDKHGDHYFITGKDFSRYSSVTVSHYINSENVQKDIEHAYGKKIIVRQVGDRINATYDPLKCVMPQSIYYIVPNAQLSYQYILALLNSSLYNFIYQNKYRTKEIFPRILLENLKCMPVVAISEKDQEQFVKLVDQILEIRTHKPQADTSPLETEINKVVYRLYNLTEDEIAVIEQ